MNVLVFIGAALVPLIFGAIWYNPKFGFGNAWLKASGLSNEYARGANMAVIMPLLLLFSLMLSLALSRYTVHQYGVESLFINNPDFKDPNSEISKYTANFKSKYGSIHRTFGHGAFHGVLAGLFFAMPFIATGALFERRGFKYIAIHVGYWLISCAIMCGILSAFLKV